MTTHNSGNKSVVVECASASLNIGRQSNASLKAMPFAFWQCVCSVGRKVAKYLNHRSSCIIPASATCAMFVDTMMRVRQKLIGPHKIIYRRSTPFTRLRTEGKGFQNSSSKKQTEQLGGQ